MRQVIELGEAQARAECAKNEARNALATTITDFELAKALVDIVPAALAQAMKPIEKISDTRCVSACKFGSDSISLQIGGDLVLVSRRNQRDGSGCSAF